MTFAEEVGLDMDAFTTCYHSGEHTQDVLDSFDQGQALGVNGTPTLFVNGEKIAYSGWEDLSQQLDTLLVGE